MSYLEFKVKIFDELTVYEIYEILKSRSAVFMLEQGIICQDMDDVDKIAHHCFLEEDGRIIAYLRAFMKDGSAYIGRVLTTERNKGFGRELMEKSIAYIKENFDTDTIVLHSQSAVSEFYRKLGFIKSSDEFLEEGVCHVEMKLRYDI